MKAFDETWLFALRTVFYPPLIDTLITIVMIDLSLLIDALKRRSISVMFMQVAESQIVRYRAARTACALVGCAIAICMGFATANVVAQQPDPFGNPGDEILTVTPLDDPSLSDTNRIILRSVRDSNPFAPEELARAVRVMIDIGIYRDAKFYLAQIEGLNLDDAKMFEMHEKVGTDFFFMVMTESAVQPEGKRVAKNVLAAADKVATTPARMGALIKSLNDSDISIRSEAFRKLRRLGDPAVAELVNVFGDPSRAPEYPGVRGALKHMGIAAQGPLLGAARATDLRVKAEAIRALGDYESSEATDVLMKAYASPDLPQVIRRIALDSLGHAKVPADPEVVEERLYRRSREYLMGRKINGALLGDVTLWDWDTGTKRLVPNQVAPATAARIIASRQAADLYEIRPDLQRNRDLYLLTQLEAAKRMAGQANRVNVEALVEKLNIQPEEIEKTLAQALNMDLIPAAVACCEVIEQIGSVEILDGTNGRPCKLIDAILSGDRSLQFAAFEAISKLDPDKAYPGSSYVIELAVFFAQSGNRSVGIVGHNQEDVGQSYAATLASAGVVGISVNSSREFFQAAKNNPDIEYLLVTDTLDKPNYVELIQQLQHDWRTRRIPVALLYHDAERSRRARMRIGNHQRFIAVPFSLDPQMVASHIRRLDDLAGPWKLTNYQRRRQASQAVRWLAQISTNREKYGFYDLGKMQLPLARLLYLPGFVETASQILANLGTPSAQRELVNFASQSGYPFEERQKVVEAFRQSVQNGGTLLTTREVRQQYQRYNASATEAAETQKVLGAILDVIEARNRKISD